MLEELRILLLEDRPADAELIARALRRAGLAFTLRRVATREAFLHELGEFAPNLILADFFVPQFSALEALPLARKLGPPAPFIIVTGSTDEETAAECIKAGADDYVIKDRLVRLPAAVRGALQRQRERAERRRAVEGFRALVESSLQGVVIFRPQSVAYVNQTFAGMMGYTVEEIEAMPFSTFQEHVHPGDYALVWGRFRNRSAGKEVPQHYEFRVLRRDGSVRWLEMFASTLTYDGEPAVLASLIDITDRKRAEAELRASEERFAKAFLVSPDALVITRLQDGLVIDANERFLTVTGYARDEAVGRTAAELHSWRDPAERTRFVEALAASPDGLEVSAELQRRDGSTFKALVLARAIELGGEACVIACLRDVSELRRLEEETGRLRQACSRLEAENAGLRAEIARRGRGDA